VRVDIAPAAGDLVDVVFSDALGNAVCVLAFTREEEAALALKVF
jgi:hypothetical protein